MNAYLHSVRKPLKACADHTQADHTRVLLLLVWSAFIKQFKRKKCVGHSSESLKRGKLSAWGEKSTWPA